jgi:mannose/fructose/N-acetylgalactosamine-specific phosphotransferase system component IID
MMISNIPMWFLLLVPVYLVGAWTISGWLYTQVKSGIYMYEMYMVRKIYKKEVESRANEMEESNA